MNEVVVTFKSKDRCIAMYFTEENGDLQMQMNVSPELKPDEEPDLTMLLASTFLNSIQKEDKNDEPSIITAD